MRALTLHGVHAHHVMRGTPIKDVENRTWMPAAQHIGTRIAIHAGNTPCDPDTDDDELPLPRAQLPRRCILGTVLLVGVVSHEHAVPADRRGTLTAAQRRAALRSRWFDGPFGWVLADPQPLARPIVTSGALGLWTVPARFEGLLLPG